MIFKCSCGTEVEEKEAMIVSDGWLIIDGMRRKGYRKIYYIPDCPTCGKSVHVPKENSTGAERWGV